MDHFGGLDVSVKETSICIVDDTGRIMAQAWQTAGIGASAETTLSVSFWRSNGQATGFRCRHWQSPVELQYGIRNAGRDRQLRHRR
jgi:hypothetical protein